MPKKKKLFHVLCKYPDTVGFQKLNDFFADNLEQALSNMKSYYHPAATFVEKSRSKQSVVVTTEVEGRLLTLKVIRQIG